eukprot:506618-Alexandrium_andersonii.AAC.1
MEGQGWPRIRAEAVAARGLPICVRVGALGWQGRASVGLPGRCSWCSVVAPIAFRLLQLDERRRRRLLERALWMTRD